MVNKQTSHKENAHNHAHVQRPANIPCWKDDVNLLEHYRIPKPGLGPPKRPPPLNTVAWQGKIGLKNRGIRYASWGITWRVASPRGTSCIAHYSNVILEEFVRKLEVCLPSVHPGQS